MPDAYIVYAEKSGLFRVLKRCYQGCYHDHVETRDGMVAEQTARQLNNAEPASVSSPEHFGGAITDALPAGDSE